MTVPGPWRLHRFDEALDNWRAHEQPNEARVRAVALWMAARADAGTEGCTPDPRVPGQWFAEVRGTATARSVVVCSFLVHREEGRLQCTTLATQPRPVTAGEWDPAWEPTDD